MLKLIPMSRNNVEACVEALRYKARNEAGQSQAPYLFEAEETPEWALSNYLLKASKQASQPAPQFKERADVLAFQQKFRIPMAQEPSWLPEELFQFRYKFLQEELHELYTAQLERDMEGAADALVDLAYVLHGTALMMGLPWPMLWAEVQRANMAKERATSAEQSKRGSSFDVIKPAGWEGPDHSKALGKGPWPTLKVEES